MTFDDLNHMKTIFPANSILECELHLLYMKGVDSRRYPLSVAAVPPLFGCYLIKEYAHITEHSGIFNAGKFIKVVEWLYTRLLPLHQSTSLREAKLCSITVSIPSETVDQTFSP